MGTWLAVAIGGALGSIGRHGMVVGVERGFGLEAYHGVFAANVLGSLVIGFLYVVLMEKMSFPDYWRALLVVGFLGAFTTFSTYSLHAIQLIEAGRLMHALAYIVGSVVVCIAATYIAIACTRTLIS